MRIAVDGTQELIAQTPPGLPMPRTEMPELGWSTAHYPTVSPSIATAIS